MYSHMPCGVVRCHFDLWLRLRGQEPDYLRVEIADSDVDKERSSFLAVIAKERKR